MVVSIRPNKGTQKMAPPMMAPKKPRNMFGAGASPVAGLMTQQFDKPGMTLSDKIAIASGMLMDYDGTFGAGNADKARGFYDQRVDEQRGEFDANRQAKILEAAAMGDPTALAMLDPVGAQRFKYEQERTAIGDQRYADETQHARNREQVGDKLGGKQWQRGIFESDRAFDAAEQARRAASTPRSIWQSAGEGAIFNQGSGEIRNAWGGNGGAGGGMGAPDSRQLATPFFESQGITADMFHPTQFVTEGEVGVNQQGVYDDTRPDDQPRNGSGIPPSDGPYNTYRQRTRGTADAKRIEAIRETTGNAVNDLDVLLGEIETLVDEGTPSGAFAEQRLALGKANAGLQSSTGLDLSGVPGIPTREQTAQMSAMKGINTRLGLTMTALTKGAISNMEMEMFLQSVPGLTNTPEGNKMISQTMRNLQSRVIQHGQSADVWDQTFGSLSAVNPRTGQSFDQAWADYTRANPFFDTRKAPAQGAPTSGAAPQQGRAPRSRGDGGPRAQKYERTATNPQTGEKVGLVNGKWVPIE